MKLFNGGGLVKSILNKCILNKLSKTEAFGTMLALAIVKPNIP
jgi:hypothetical protein